MDFYISWPLESGKGEVVRIAYSRTTLHAVKFPRNYSFQSSQLHICEAI